MYETGKLTILLDRITEEFARIGLNIVGVASGERWQAILPECKSVIVFGSGGRQLWEAFVAELRSHPEFFINEPHPLDAFVQRTLVRVDPKPPVSRRWIRCAPSESQFVDFRPLALEAGLGWESKLGLLINPKFGPWIGLRLACFVSDFLEPTGPLPGSGPCDSCDAPCVKQCPAQAVSRSSRWNVERCAAFHESFDQCSFTCYSREACPVGNKYKYPELERTYHSNRKIGRQLLARELRLDSDGIGSAPYWKDWA